MLNGREQNLKPKDMMTTDSVGILSTVIYGPDKRTRIVRQTKNALFVVYAPPGIGSDPVRKHLDDITKNVELFSPNVSADFLEVFVAQG
jgi:DNA/RNA-binding domain of Phe-tRNA-synthetase-like protein